MIAKRDAFLGADVEVVGMLSWMISAKGFSVFDSQVSAMFVSELGQRFLGEIEMFYVGYHDVDVDHGLGVQARHGGAADVFDGERECTDGGPEMSFQLLKMLRPVGIIGNDEDGFPVHDFVHAGFGFNSRFGTFLNGACIIALPLSALRVAKSRRPPPTDSK